MKRHAYGKSSREKLKGVHPDLVKFAEMLLDMSGYDLGISEGVRTLERQQELYAQGRTKPGCIVTNVDGIKYKSNHQIQSDGYGHALDIFVYNENGRVDYRNTTMNYIGALGKMISFCYFNGNIQWGGDWTSPVDKPHWELILNNPKKPPLTKNKLSKI